MVREAEERRKIRLKTSLTNLMDFEKEELMDAKGSDLGSPVDDIPLPFLPPNPGE